MCDLGEEWSFLVLLSDGITDVISDQEIIDLVRGHRDPTQAAKKIVSFAEDVGGYVHNPLSHWFCRD